MKVTRGNKTKRVLSTMSDATLDVKVPARDIDETLDISDGMIKLFRELAPAACEAVRGDASTLVEKKVT